MRSPVVWLCFAVVVLCVLGAESSVRRGFHIIHGQAGPIIRSVIPVNGVHRSAPVHIQGRRVQRQEDYDEEEEEEDEEDEENFEGEYAGLVETGGGPGPLAGYPVGAVPGPEGYYEEEDEEEEDEEEEEEDYGDERSLNEVVQGRQAFINNQYIDSPNSLRQSNRPNRQQNGNNNPNRRQQNGNNNNPNRRQQNGNNNPNRGGNNGNRPGNPNRRRPTTAPVVDRPQRNRQKTTPAPVQVAQQQSAVNKQKLQLRPVASSTQFIATPVADLILRLSISLAKPVGHGNTTFNVPIRVHPAPGFSNVIQLEANKPEIESGKVDPVETVAVNLVHNKEDLSEEGDDGEDDDKDQGADDIVTEMPRK